MLISAVAGQHRILVVEAYLKRKSSYLSVSKILTADSDYPTAPCVIDVVARAVEHGIFGYSWEYPEYLASIQWWMKTRHNWNIDTDWILTSQGLGNAIALCLDLWSKPEDSIVIFTPVYHEFALKIKRSDRKAVECSLVREAESYTIDFEDAQKRLTGAEKNPIMELTPESFWTHMESKRVNQRCRVLRK